MKELVYVAPDGEIEMWFFDDEYGVWKMRISDVEGYPKSLGNYFWQMEQPPEYWGRKLLGVL